MSYVIKRIVYSIYMILIGFVNYGCFAPEPDGVKMTELILTQGGNCGDAIASNYNLSVTTYFPDRNGNLKVFSTKNFNHRAGDDANFPVLIPGRGDFVLKARIRFIDCRICCSPSGFCANNQTKATMISEYSSRGATSWLFSRMPIPNFVISYCECC